MPILNWLTRDDDIRAASRVPYRLLEEAPELSAGDPAAGNMLIQGDNLDALKALLPFYAGQVKCIYIDPPYNTRSAFEHYDDNLEHAKWLSLMWPRLELLRDLLSEDGSIWVSIDDNEGHYLKVIMDEVFGRSNFIATFVWERDAGGRGDASVSVSHDFLLCYALKREVWVQKRNLLKRTTTQSGRFRNPDGDPRGPWRQGDDGTAKSGTGKQRFPIELPSGRVVTPKPGRYWAFSEATFRKAREEGRAYFGKNGDRLPLIKRYLGRAREGVAPRTWWPASEAGTNQSAKRDHLRKLLPEMEPFSTPKPEELVSRVIQISSNPGDIVLDSFLGSGTTAAVALKMNRRFIGNELGDQAVSYCAPRLKKVINGEQGGISEAVGWKGGGGYRFYRLGPPVFDEEGHIRADISFPVLAAHIWFSETATPWAATRRTPFLGIHGGTAFALLYNGILGDKRPDGGNVLTRATLATIRAAITKANPAFAGPLTIYGEQSRITPPSLDREAVTFKQTPYDVKARR
jgi:adenine-specific DNA-methyltransferase